MNNNLEKYLTHYDKIKFDREEDYLKSLYTDSHSLIKDILNLCISDTSNKKIGLIKSSFSIVSENIIEQINELEKIKDINETEIQNDYFFLKATKFYYFLRENKNYSL